uniref:multicopper oxidase domain-containing protein n=1 Tax=Yoonia sp. TaxID=2212373 RepID=UPI0040487359
MIMRLYLIAGVLLLGTTAYFIVVQQEPDYQAAPLTSEITKLQDSGLLPAGPFEENEELEHGVFEVPPMDEMMLEQAESNMDMAGMDMSQSDGTTMDMADGGTMTMADGTTMPMADMAPADSGTMTMADGATLPMADMAPAAADTMTMADGATMPMADMAPADSGTMTMADGATMPMADMAPADSGIMPMTDMVMPVACTGERGLGFCDDGQAFDREIELAMSEWTFSDLNVAVQAGERIRFTVRNDGTVLHEFMFMAMEQMQAVNYRARRADWNLLEHEALFEQSLLLPGQSISFVVEVQNAGNWMFMCMLPYHMQMGMMGQMSTPGAAMDM